MSKTTSLTCWLLQCPLEIRRLIYTKTFEVQTIFSLIDQEHVAEYTASSTLLPICEQALPPFDTEFDDLEDPQLEDFMVQQQAGEAQHGPRFAFRLVPKERTPFLLVNRAIHDEVQDTIEFTLRKSKLHLTSSVRGLWFNTLSVSTAIDLVRCSHFELCCDANVSLAWLLRLDSRFSSHIRSVAIYRSNMYGVNGRPHRAWQMRWPPVGGVAHAPMLRVLREKLRGLRELAVWFPRDHQLCCWHDLSNMLSEEGIDTLRFLVDYKVACPKEEPRFQTLLLSSEIEIGRLVRELGPNWSLRMHEAIAKETRRLVAERPKFNFKVEHSDAEGQVGLEFRAKWSGATCAVSFRRWARGMDCILSQGDQPIIQGMNFQEEDQSRRDET